MHVCAHLLHQGPPHAEQERNRAAAITSQQVRLFRLPFLTSPLEWFAGIEDSPCTSGRTLLCPRFSGDKQLGDSMNYFLTNAGHFMDRIRSRGSDGVRVTRHRL